MARISPLASEYPDPRGILQDLKNLGAEPFPDVEAFVQGLIVAWEREGRISLVARFDQLPHLRKAAILNEDRFVFLTIDYSMGGRVWLRMLDLAKEPIGSIEPLARGDPDSYFKALDIFVRYMGFGHEGAVKGRVEPLPGTSDAVKLTIPAHALPEARGMPSDREEQPASPHGPKEIGAPSKKREAAKSGEMSRDIAKVQRELENTAVPKRRRLEWLRDSRVWVPLTGTLITGICLLINSVVQDTLERHRIATSEAKTQTAQARSMATEEASRTAAVAISEGSQTAAAATGTAYALPQVTATPIPPGDTVSRFFELLSRAEYPSAWDLMHPDLQGGLSNYAGWEGFWRNAGLVEVRQTVILSVTQYTSTVFIEVQFLSEPGRHRGYLARLVFDPQVGRWLITSLAEET